MKNVKLLIELTVDGCELRYYGMSVMRVGVSGWKRTTITEQWKRDGETEQIQVFQNGIYNYDKFEIQYGLRR